MPTLPKDELQKLLLDLIKKPKRLHEFKKDSSGFINKSKLPKAHKQILLGGDVGKIKQLVSRAVAKPEFAIVIHGDDPNQPLQTAAFQIHIGAAPSQVQVSLKQRPAKSKKIEVSAIHIMAKSEV